MKVGMHGGVISGDDDGIGELDSETRGDDVGRWDK
jgi:hypothetical protein